MSINIGEILVILVIALLVIRPERLPEVARLLGRWFRKCRQLITSVQGELEGRDERK